MKTLQEIKDEVAQEAGYDSWGDVLNYEVISTHDEEELVNQIAKRYALQAIEADRADCAENARTEEPHCTVSKDSILNRPYPEMK